MNLTSKVLIGMTLGIIAGLIINLAGLNGSGSIINVYFVDGFFHVIGKLFVNALKMLVVPLVLFSLICGVCGIGDIRLLGRVGSKSFMLYMLTTAVAIATAIMLAAGLGIGEGMNAVSSATFTGKDAPPLTQVLIDIVPTNPIQAMASGELEMGWAWNQSELNLIWNETPAKMMRDVDKGIATWVCGYVHLKSSTTPVEQIYDHLNALSDAASGKYIIESWGYPHANAEAYSISDQDLIAQYGFDDPKAFFEGSLFFDAVDPALEAKMLKEFERIKAGF